MEAYQSRIAAGLADKGRAAVWKLQQTQPKCINPNPVTFGTKSQRVRVAVTSSMAGSGGGESGSLDGYLGVN